jgi:hypothetical protein
MKTSRLPIIRSIVAALSIACAPGARAQSATVLEALRVERHEAVHFEAAALQGRGVIVNQWTAPITLQVVSSKGSGGLYEHTASALKALDERLVSIGSPRTHVLKVNAFVRSEDAVSARGVADVLHRYFADGSHASRSAWGRKTAPVIEVFVADDGAARYFGIAGTAAVVLHATVLDPGTSSEDLRTDPGLDYRPDSPRLFIIGPIATDGGGQEALRTAFDAVRGLMIELGARPGDVEEVLVYGRVDEADVRVVAAGLLDGALPLVDYDTPRLTILPATPADAAAAIEVTGRVTY